MGKHATYRGIPSDHYRQMRNSMSAEAFGKWVQSVTGKPRNTRKRDPLIAAYESAAKNAQMQQLQYQKSAIDWESLAKKLQAALAAQMNECQALTIRIEELENRSWLSRLFNLKG